MPKSFEDIGIFIPPGSHPNASGEIAMACPFCSSERTTRSHANALCLSVNVGEGVWHCNHCQRGGNIMKQDYMPKPKPKPEIVTPREPSDKTLGQGAIAWLDARHISERTANDFGLWSGHGTFNKESKPCICIPYRYNGRLANVKYRSAVSKEFTQTAHARRTFFNVDAISKEDRQVVFAEGEMDVLALHESGIKCAISVPFGANSLTDEVMDSGKHLLERKDREFVIAGDDDSDGRDLQRELIRRIGPARCSVVSWPDGCKDANDVLMQYGKEALRKCISAAVHCPIPGVLQVGDLENGYWGRYVDGPARGLQVGWESLRPFYSVRPGEITVVTGIPGHGKSGIVDDLLVYLAKTSDWKFGVFSPENLPLAEEYLPQLASKYTGMPFDDGPSPRMSTEQAAEAFEFLSEHFLPIYADEISFPGLLDVAQSLVYRHGIRGLLIDPWNGIDHQYDKQTLADYIERNLRFVQRFSRSHGVHVWIVAHPHQQVAVNGRYQKIDGYGVSGGANWYNKADNLLVITRDTSEPSAPIDVDVIKVRFRATGRIGLAKLFYDRTTGKYHDIPMGGYDG